MSQVLIVDDSSTVRTEVSDFLSENGLVVATAVDGVDGIKKLKADPAIKVVITDVNMPNMDGLSMCEYIRNVMNNKTINIIMLTTESSPSMKERGKAAGVKGWIVKPFKGAAIIGVVKKMVG